MRKYLNHRIPRRGKDPVESIANVLEKIGKTPWLLLGLLVFITIFFVIHGSITGFSIENIPKYEPESLSEHVTIITITLIGLFILNKYVKNTKKSKLKSK